MMRRLAIIPLLLLFVACGTISDALTPNVPNEIAVAQDNANHLAFDILKDLELWLDAPEQIPSDAPQDTEVVIDEILMYLRKVHRWALADGMDEKNVVEPLVTLMESWEEWILAEFCGEEGWLANPVPVTEKIKAKYLVLFKEMRKSHKLLREWMEDKGVIDES